ncbi:MAG: hypothetical protein WC364_15460 [Eubacteriales bacterium]|jgi:hypothetical protein
MYGRNIAESIHAVPAIWPVDLNTGANAGDYISLKNYPVGGVLIQIGASAGTIEVTMYQAKDVAATGEKALSFTEMFMTGCKLKVNTKTGTFTVGETVTGAGGASAVVYADMGTYLLLYTVNETAFVDTETVTGTSGYTASADGIGIDEDILLRVAVTGDTFTIPDRANRIYFIPFEAMMLDLDDDFDCIRVHLDQATGSVIGGAVYILDPNQKGRPMLTAIYD